MLSAKSTMRAHIYKTMGDGWIEIAEAKKACQPVRTTGFIP
jgi:hypothetical protein